MTATVGRGHGGRESRASHGPRFAIGDELFRVMPATLGAGGWPKPAPQCPWEAQSPGLTRFVPYDL